MPLILPRRALLATATTGLLARPGRAGPRPAVIASFSILGDLVRQIAADRVALRVLAGPETDAHVFQPRPSDADAIRRAALVVRNGLGFEPWLDRVMRGTGYAGPVVTATEGITPLRAAATPGHAHGPDAPDPHAWQDVRLALAYMRRIAEGLAAADPDGAAATREAAGGYAGRLAALDAWVRERLAAVPPDRRVLITSHEAFGYFAAAYGVRVLAPQGMGGPTQPSAQQVAALIRRIRAERISAVFLEGPGSQAVIERIARDAGVAPRGRLYADTLSAADGPAPTYEAMVRHNLDLMIPAMLGG